MNWRVVLNEQHTLLPDQVRELNEKLGPGGKRWTILHAPASGWTVGQMREIAAAWPRSVGAVMASPIMGLALELCRAGRRVSALVNDRREAVEVKNPDGSVRIQHRVAADGWQII